MRFLLILIIFCGQHTVFAKSKDVNPWTIFLNRPELELKRADLIVYDHFLQIYKVAEKGYASAYLLDKGLKESAKNPRLVIFHEWLNDLKRFSSLPHDELIQTCFELKNLLSTTYGLQRKLLLQRINYCRQIALQQMAPKALADGGFTITDMNFLKRFMYHFLHGRNQSDFIWFLKRFEGKDDLNSVVSTLVIEEVIRRNKQVPRDILPHIVITPDLTRHIQQYGLDSESMRQIFYTEFSRMIDDIYKSLNDSKRDVTQSRADQILTWLSLNLQRLPLTTSLGRLSDLGKNLWRNAYSDSAIQIFDYVARHGNPEQREDAWFFRLWMWGSRDEWKDAYKWLNKQNIVSSYSKLIDSRLKFWIALTLQKNEMQSEAKALWEELIKRHPLSFYGIMASKALQTHHPQSTSLNFYRSIDERNAPTIDPAVIDTATWEAWKRLRAWARLDNKIFLAAELKGFDKHLIPIILARVEKNKVNAIKSDMHLINASLIGNEENYLESFRVIYAALDSEKVFFNRFLLEILYPRPYLSELQKALKSAKLDPLLLLSLIRQESVFNPGAKSRVGARGLMQLMPTTAKRLQRGVGEKQLDKPNKNIELGAKYFQQLHKRYNGNLVYVLSAYNAGESRVERWKNQYFSGDDLMRNIEMIPFQETRNYVKLIFRNIFFYKTLVASQDQIDPANPNQIYDIDLGFKH
jgi:soluble lytic murein transglycosylase